MTGGRCSEVINAKKFQMGPQNGGRYRQVVALWRQSLVQVLLYPESSTKLGIKCW